MTHDAPKTATALHPAEQGAYDYLCSIYTIINARRWLDGMAGDPDSVFAAPVLDLYRQLVTAATAMMPAPDLLTAGPGPEQVARLIATSGLTSREATHPAELDSHMQADGSCAIIHFTYLYETRRPDHYSLLIRHAGAQALLDSYQFALQGRDGWSLRFTPETGLPQGAEIRRCWLIDKGQPCRGLSSGSE
ncbi:hypothetical protein PE067_14575 [Paracoccus sp. DMF-8]|uniref:hypothetical protein n=1 Tax=Paracoccus sp. DMF-8 TaxID=3019445 RepID=UPI0023E35273|nr:hypothetical protein [Paracoccus sp. DMF-8]MDF3607243.1 hypothetical protein [Paracoccus sp. DMF-8]